MGNVVPPARSALVVAESAGDWPERWRVLGSGPSVEKRCKEEDVPMYKVLNCQMGGPSDELVPCLGPYAAPSQ